MGGEGNYTNERGAFWQLSIASRAQDVRSKKSLSMIFYDASSGVIAYTPHGETLIEHEPRKAANKFRCRGARRSVSEVGAGFNTPYQYTGKELDPATNLYYYGARYYDPKTSVWQSTDPIMDKYMSGGGNTGGVYNSKNLGLYTYTHNNPVNAIDPDGRDLITGVGGVMTESYNYVTGNGYNAQSVNGAFLDGSNQILYLELGVEGNVDLDKGIAQFNKIAKEKGLNMGDFNISQQIGKVKTAGEFEGVGSVMVAAYFENGRYKDWDAFVNFEAGVNVGAGVGAADKTFSGQGFVNIGFASDPTLKFDDLAGTSGQNNIDIGFKRFALKGSRITPHSNPNVDFWSIGAGIPTPNSGVGADYSSTGGVTWRWNDFMKKFNGAK